ncbi:MAG: hypothetical protein CO093_03835 [Alphaproteobacteria bacterium CG_4_9_14_3_um_filter_47_13]|nr:MAG: hypothetical protein CO093_03835 [Alphaproteobacteria bacterium CG_4_9_14_3_um_filter_47_13]
MKPITDKENARQNTVLIEPVAALKDTVSIIKRVNCSILPFDTPLPEHTEIEPVILPSPPSSADMDSLKNEIYKCFMKSLYKFSSHNARPEILPAIESVSTTLDISTAFVAKTLTDLGLRAPRREYPASFLDFADHAHSKFIESYKTPSCIAALQDYWRAIKEHNRMIQ